MKKLSRWQKGQFARGRKRPHQRAVRTTISMKPIAFDAAVDRMKLRGIRCFSKFMETLVLEEKNRPSYQMELPLTSGRGSFATHD
jgi:hypothetical protein